MNNPDTRMSMLFSLLIIMSWFFLIVLSSQNHKREWREYQTQYNLLLAGFAATPEGQPEISVTVNLDGKSIGEDRYQVNMKLNARAANGETARFLVELDYSGIFSMQNVPEAHIHPMMFIECPRLILPFARRVVADITRDGGYPPLMLDNVDFATLYRQKLEQLRQEKQQMENPN